MRKILEILNDLRPEFDFTKSNSFIDDGFLDSFDIISIVDELEEEYGIKIDGLEIVPENFQSVNSIFELVKKCGGNIE